MEVSCRYVHIWLPVLIGILEVWLVMSFAEVFALHHRFYAFAKTLVSPANIFPLHMDMSLVGEPRDAYQLHTAETQPQYHLL